MGSGCSREIPTEARSSDVPKAEVGSQIPGQQTAPEKPPSQGSLSRAPTRKSRLGGEERGVEKLEDKYTLGAELGRGCFGVTRLATVKTTKEVHACKSISKARAQSNADPRGGSRSDSCTGSTGMRQNMSLDDLRREISILYHLQGHPNVVQLHGTYEDKHNVHLVMEKCEGGELFDHIVEAGRYTEKDAARILRTILKVAAQCHALGVCHRDLKPENFLLSTAGSDAQLKAIDFGLSTFFQPNGTLTEFVGSPYYMAPEVLARNYGPKVDCWSVGVILYILLTGVPPFNANSQEGILRAVREGDYDLESPPWPKISTGAKHLVRRLLCYDPVKRISAIEALDHPWVREATGVVGEERGLRAPGSRPSLGEGSDRALDHSWVREDGEASDELLDDSITLRIKKFAEVNRLKKMALKIIAENLSAEEISGLEEIFKSFDTDGDGTITLAEMDRGLSKMAKQGTSSKLTKDHVKQLMAAADVDSDGVISYQEFITSTLQMNKLDSDEHLHKAFMNFDTDNSGYITREELRAALSENGSSVEEIEAIIGDVDKDNDGNINYVEFAAMMRSRA
ncbi:Calcium-dependent protein kinase 15 [Cymbomonas tetramitiformis]|uniref:Calcium-dependent protein kinase 15 n=1 Tax=Cymbomonas tetramitiformis TaxID=36881 RepID=A0AAE0ETN4_9CHLO|nr:Calcium-dependent protein kinase 15 [Cymbomonas tetramitiformis]